MVLDHPNNVDSRGSTFNDIRHDQNILNNAIINHQTSINLNVSLFGTQNSSDLPPRGSGISQPTPMSKDSLYGATAANYSFNDAVFVIDAAISLVAQIANVLINHQDHSSDHQGLELELKVLHQILDLTRLAIQEYDGRPLGQNLVNTVTPEVQRCRMLLRELLEKLTGTWKSLLLTKISGVWHKVWHGRWDSDELALLRKGLSSSRHSLGMFLWALNSIAWMALGNELAAGHVSLNRFHLLLKRRLPSLGHIKINAVQVVNHLGDIIPVPTIFCSTWKSIHHVIYSYCQNRVGHHFIATHDYALIRASDSQVVDPSKIADEIEPGTILEMSIVVWQRRAYQKKCPRCGSANLNTTITENGWIECRRCPGRFCVTIMAVNGEAPINEEADSPISLDNQSKSGEQAAVENSQEYDSDSTLFFRRIHLICLPRRIFGMGILGQLRGPIDFDRQCGAINVRNLPCSRSLACKVHSLDRKRAVQGRSKPYDELWLEWNGAINSRWADQQEPKRGGIMKRRRVPC